MLRACWLLSRQQMTLRATWPGALAAPAQTRQLMRSAFAQLLTCNVSLPYVVGSFL